MMNKSGKKFTSPSQKRATSLALIFLLVSTSLFANSTASLASEETITCTTQTYTFTENNDNQTPALNSTGFALPYNAHAMDILALAGYNATVTFADGTTLDTVAIYPADFSGDGNSDALIIQVSNGTSMAKSSDHAWPLSITYAVPQPSQLVENSYITFSEFSPCKSKLQDAYTTSSYSAFGWGNFGAIQIFQGMDGDGERWDPLTANGSPMATRSVTKSTDGVVGSTTYTYLVENYYSQDATAFVDISVEVKFDGNTITWQVRVFEHGTSTPAELTFRLLGTYAGFDSTVHGTSNGYTYSTTTAQDGFPILVYNTDGSFTPTDEFLKFNFPSGSTSGFVEVSVLGYENCSTTAAITAALADFTSNYSVMKNTDIPEVAGTCSSSSQHPKTSAPPTPDKSQVKVTSVSGALNVALTYSGQNSSRPSNYEVHVSPSGKMCVAYGKNSSCEIPGLKIGRLYKVSIVALNEVGRSGTYTSPQKYLLTNTEFVSLQSRGHLNSFTSGSAKLHKALRAEINKFLAKYPNRSIFSCTGYSSRLATKAEKLHAAKRAAKACAFIEKIRPSASITIGKIRSLKAGAANKQVEIGVYSPLT
jgi:hypothetical protein